jgi:hypothetical protein
MTASPKLPWRWRASAERPVDEAVVREALAHIGEVYEGLPPYRRKDLIRLVLDRVEVSESPWLIPHHHRPRVELEATQELQVNLLPHPCIGDRESRTGADPHPFLGPGDSEGLGRMNRVPGSIGTQSSGLLAFGG